jgi:hypothetical protein
VNRECIVFYLQKSEEDQYITDDLKEGLDKLIKTKFYFQDQWELFAN